MKRANYIFVTGIDTDAGKSIVTGLYYKYLLSKSEKVITFKAIQTGCKDIAEDIVTHREIAGVKLTKEDINGETCPYLFNHPCSPHLAAQIENRIIDPHNIIKAANRLSDRYDKIVIEGAGGLMVPITGQYTSADFVKDYRIPVLLVTSSKLGSINHTLLTLEYIKSRGIELSGIIYNDFPNNDTIITDDSYRVISDFAEKMFYDVPVLRVPVVDDSNSCNTDWGLIKKWL
jgi:dethiobiotin synthetase